MEYTVREPSFRQLRRVAVISAVPFVGFGIMDNAIMIVVSCCCCYCCYCCYCWCSLGAGRTKQAHFVHPCPCADAPQTLDATDCCWFGNKMLDYVG